MSEDNFRVIILLKIRRICHQWCSKDPKGSVEVNSSDFTNAIDLCYNDIENYQDMIQQGKLNIFKFFGRISVRGDYKDLSLADSIFEAEVRDRGGAGYSS